MEAFWLLALGALTSQAKYALLMAAPAITRSTNFAGSTLRSVFARWTHAVADANSS